MTTQINLIRQMGALFQKQQGLWATPANVQQLSVIEWWNALMFETEYQIEVRTQREHAEDEFLAIYGEAEQPLYCLHWNPMEFLSWEQGTTHIHLPNLLNAESLNHEYGVSMSVEWPFLILEEGARKNILLDLDLQNGKAIPLLQEISSVVILAYLNGLDTFEISKRLKQAILLWDIPWKMEPKTELRFADLSSIQSIEQLQVLVERLEEESVIVLGGMTRVVPPEITKAMVQKNITLILIEYGSAVEIDDVNLSLVRVDSFSSAYRKCFEIVESPCSIYFFTGIQLRSESAADMARCFMQEVGL